MDDEQHVLALFGCRRCRREVRRSALASTRVPRPTSSTQGSPPGCSESLSSLDPATLTEFGHLLETFVVGEIRKQTSWLDEPVALGQWRTSEGAEVDLVLSSTTGLSSPFEVKANERAVGPDFRGLAQLRDLAGGRFRAGVVVITGRRSYTYADRPHGHAARQALATIRGAEHSADWSVVATGILWEHRRGSERSNRQRVRR